MNVNALELIPTFRIPRPDGTYRGHALVRALEHLTRWRYYDELPEASATLRGFRVALRLVDGDAVTESDLQLLGEYLDGMADYYAARQGSEHAILRESAAGAIADVATVRELFT